eukprot:c54504_g1_i1 orf=631-1992(-)
MMAPPRGERRPSNPVEKRKLNKEELAVLLSVVATALVIVQRFLIDNQLLLFPTSQTMALEASFKATTLALSKLQMMFSIAKVVSLSELEEMQGVDKDHAAGRKSWFEDFLCSETDVTKWRQRFRMSRVAFFNLLEIVGPALQRQDTNMKDALPPEVKLGAALYRLAHGVTFKALSRKFGIGTSSSCKAFYEVCKTLQDKLNHLVDLPSTADGLNPIIERFSAQGMPNCCGVIGCTQFLLEKTPLNACLSTSMDCRDENGNHTVQMQAVVDATGRFLDISVGWGGSLSPGNILPQTTLFSRVESGELLGGPPLELINRALIPEYIIGDQSYPLLPWLITPYLDTGLTATQPFFNTVHEYVRGTVSRAFGTLKAHWQLLSSRQRVENLELLPFIVAAACILQNFLINNGEPIPDVHEFSSREPYILPQRNEYAESIREALLAHISTVARMQLDFQ